MMCVMKTNALLEIDRSAGNGGTPLWEQIANVIAGEVIDWAPGVRLPSESEQRARFAVSRVTLRQALMHVQLQGLVESKPGLGWFVVDGKAKRDAEEAPASRQPLFEPPGKLMSFSDMARSRTLHPDSVVLEKKVHSATFEEAESLGIAPGADVLLLRRLRRLDGLSVAVDCSLLPLAVLPHAMDIDFSRASLHDSFRAAGAQPTTADTEVEAVVADAKHATMLDVPEGFPLLKIRQAFFDASGRAIERGLIIYRADRYRYRARLRA